jgi:hypothetical protein
MLPGGPGDRATEPALFRPLHLLRSLTPPASPFAPVRVAPCLAADPLLGFCLSRAFSVHASGPQTHSNREGTSTPSARRPRSATQRTSLPPKPGEAESTRMQDSVSSMDSSPLRGWPTPPFGGVPTPMVLGTPSKLDAPDLRSLEVRGKRRFSRRAPALLRFGASSTTP